MKTFSQITNEIFTDNEDIKRIIEDHGVFNVAIIEIKSIQRVTELVYLVNGAFYLSFAFLGAYKDSFLSGKYARAVLRKRFREIYYEFGFEEDDVIDFKEDDIQEINLDAI